MPQMSFSGKYLYVCVLCAAKLESTYYDPNKAFKVHELFKECFLHPYSHSHEL